MQLQLQWQLQWHLLGTILPFSFSVKIANPELDSANGDMVPRGIQKMKNEKYRPKSVQQQKTRGKSVSTAPTVFVLFASRAHLIQQLTLYIFVRSWILLMNFKIAIINLGTSHIDDERQKNIHCSIPYTK